MEARRAHAISIGDTFVSALLAANYPHEARSIEGIIAKLKQTSSADETISGVSEVDAARAELAAERRAKATPDRKATSVIITHPVTPADEVKAAREALQAERMAKAPGQSTPLRPVISTQENIEMAAARAALRQEKNVVQTATSLKSHQANLSPDSKVKLASTSTDSPFTDNEARRARQELRATARR